MDWQRYCHGWTPLATSEAFDVTMFGMWSVVERQIVLNFDGLWCLRAAVYSWIWWSPLGGRVPVVCTAWPGASVWAVTAPVLVFSSLLSVYLKSSQIVSAGSPEVKPAEAHGSDSLLCAEVVLWPLAHVIPSFSSIFPVIVTSGVSFPMVSCWFTPPDDLFSPLKKALLSFRGMTVDSCGKCACPAENT